MGNTYKNGTDKKKKVYSDEIPRVAVGKLFNDNVKVDDTFDLEDEPVRPKTPGYKENMAALFEDEHDDDYREYIMKTKSASERSSQRRQMDRAREGQPETTKTGSGIKKPSYRADTPKADDDGLIDVEYAIPLRDVLSAYKFAIAGIAFAVILLCGFLVLRINTITKEYEDAKAATQANADYKEQAETQSFELEDLRKQVKDLKDENDGLSKQVAELTEEPQNPADPATATQNPATNVTEQPATSPTPVPTATVNSDGQRIHVVVSGENFWTISEKYYGTGAKDKEIMKENDYTDPASLQIGAKLIIP